MSDPIDRQDAIRIVDGIDTWQAGWRDKAIERLKDLPPVQPERLTDDDFETIRIHLSAYKERLCNQHRWKEAEEYQKIINRLRSFASAQPEPKWIPCSERLPENGRQVLVYARSVHYALAKYDEMRQADGSYKYEWVTFDAWKPFYRIKDVMAWMPLEDLPSPYREEGD